MKLSQLVRVAPGFKAAVNLETDWADSAKVGGYIPTAFARKAFSDIAESLSPDSKSRARLFHGSYGTGKSHLALTLCHYLADGWERGWTVPVMDRIGAADPHLAQFLTEQRKQLAAPLLFVPAYGADGSTRETLLAALDKALEREGLAHLMPATVFHAAVSRIEDFLGAFPNAATDLEQAVRQVGYPEVSSLILDLRAYKAAALKAFVQAHPLFSRGAGFDRHLAQRPEEIYRSVVRELQRLPVGQRRSGIIVVWDEFGLQLESILQDPRDRSFLDLQSFAEACSASGSDQIHFLGLTHRTIEQTVATLDGLSSRDKELLNRIAGRFEQRRVTSQVGEQFRLLSHVILPVDRTEVDRFWRKHQAWADEGTKSAARFGLFKDLGHDEVTDVVVKGTYPLHPGTTVLLPALSEKVAQNDRTLFHFLGDPGPNGLSAFLETADVLIGDAPVQMTANRLFPFFADLLANTRRDGVRELWNRFRRLPPQQDSLAREILETIVLLLVAGLPELRPNSDTLSFLFNLSTAQDRLAFGQKLEQMRTAKLLRKWPNGEFELRGIEGDIDLEESLQAALGDVPRAVGAGELISMWARRAGFPDSISATGHNEQFACNRTTTVLWTSANELGQSRFSESGAPNGTDGLVLLVAALSGEELERAREAVVGFRNPRVTIVLPHVPVVIEPLIRKYLALQLVERRLQANFGQGGSQRDEFDKERAVTVDEICSRLARSFKPCSVYLKGVHRNYDGLDKVAEVVSEGMDEAFPLTLRIPHDKLLETTSSDSYRAHRVTAVNALFQMPLDQLTAMPVKPVQFTVDSVLCQTGWLRQEGSSWVLGRPDPIENPISAAVWEVIEGYVTRPSKAPVSFLKLYDDLTSPPYGLRPRTLPLLLAAVIREHQASITLVQGGQVVQPSGDVMEKLVKEPQKTTVFYARLTNQQRWVLELFLEVFQAITPLSEEGPIGQVKRLITRWINRLPGLALRTRKLPANIQMVRDQVLQPLTVEGNERVIRKLLFETLPQSAGVADLGSANYSAIQTHLGGVLRAVKTEMENVIGNQVTPVLANAFGEPGGDDKVLKDAISALHQTAAGLNRSVLGPTEEAFVQALAEMMTQPLKHLDSLAKAVGCRVPSDWTDDDLPDLRGRIGVLRDSILAKSRERSRPDPKLAPLDLPQPPSDQELPDVKVEPTPKPVLPHLKADDRPIPNPVDQDRRPSVQIGGADARAGAPSEVVLTLGGKERRYNIGAVLPPAARNTLNMVLTAVRRPDLSRDDQARVLMEALAQIIGQRP